MKVNTTQLRDSSDETLYLAYQMEEIESTLLQLSRDIRRASATWQFSLPVMEAAIAVGNQMSDLKKMGRALDVIADVYERTEERITDHADGAADEVFIQLPRLDRFGRGYIPWVPVIYEYIIPDWFFEGIIAGLDTLLDWVPWDGT